MMVADKKNKGMFAENDAAVAAKLTEAGFGFPQAAPASAQAQPHLLHPLEVGYIISRGHSSIEGGLKSFIEAQSKKDKNFEFALSVYSAIRSTGRMVRPFMKKSNYLRAYAPGVGREEDRPSQLICLLPGKMPSAKSLVEEVRVAHLARLDLIIAIGTPPRRATLQSFKLQVLKKKFGRAILALVLCGVGSLIG